MKISSGTKCIRPVEPFDTGNFYLLSQGSVSECGNLYDSNSKKKMVYRRRTQKNGKRYFWRDFIIFALPKICKNRYVVHLPTCETPGPGLITQIVWSWFV